MEIFVEKSKLTSSLENLMNEQYPNGIHGKVILVHHKNKVLEVVPIVFGDKKINIVIDSYHQRINAKRAKRPLFNDDRF